MQRTPVFLPMVASPMIYTTSTRTTICDVMCLTNTVVASDQGPASKGQGASDAVVTSNKFSKEHMKHMTPLQRLKFAESCNQKSKDLQKERNVYMSSLQMEELMRTENMEKGAVRIQAFYRGFRVRPKKYYKKQDASAKKYRRNEYLNEIHDDLCALARKVSLDPIHGLSLEARSNLTKKRAKVDEAAATVIERFFSMVHHRRLARRRMTGIRERKVFLAVCSIQRFFRLVKLKSMKKTMIQERKEMSIVNLQCLIRSFQAKQRVKKFRAEKNMHRRQMEACTKIQRTVSPLRLRYKRKKEWKFVLALVEKHFEYWYDGVVDDLIPFALLHLTREELDEHDPFPPLIPPVPEEEKINLSVLGLTEEEQTMLETVTSIVPEGSLDEIGNSLIEEIEKTEDPVLQAVLSRAASIIGSRRASGMIISRSASQTIDEDEETEEERAERLLQEEAEACRLEDMTKLLEAERLRMNTLIVARKKSEEIVESSGIDAVTEYVQDYADGLIDSAYNNMKEICIEEEVWDAVDVITDEQIEAYAATLEEAAEDQYKNFVASALEAGEIDMLIETGALQQLNDIALAASGKSNVFEDVNERLDTMEAYEDFLEEQHSDAVMLASVDHTTEVVVEGSIVSSVDEIVPVYEERVPAVAEGSAEEIIKEAIEKVLENMQIEADMRDGFLQVSDMTYSVPPSELESLFDSAGLEDPTEVGNTTSQDHFDEALHASKEQANAIMSREDSFAKAAESGVIGEDAEKKIDSEDENVRKAIENFDDLVILAAAPGNDVQRDNDLAANASASELLRVAKDHFTHGNYQEAYLLAKELTELLNDAVSVLSPMSKYTRRPNNNTDEMLDEEKRNRQYLHEGMLLEAGCCVELGENTKAHQVLMSIKRDDEYSHGLSADLYLHEANFREAEDSYHEAIDLMDSRLAQSKTDSGFDHVHYVRLQLRLGECFRQQGRFDDTLTRIVKAEEIKLPDSVPEREMNLLYAEVKSLEARLFCDHSLFDNAVKLHSEVLEIRSKWLPSNHSKKASILHHLAIHALRKGRFTGALDLIDLALNIQTEVYPKTHPAIADTMVTKGRALAAMGRYDEAVITLEAAHTANTKHFSCHPRLGDTHYWLADTRHRQGHPIAARKDYEAAVDIRSKCFVTNIEHSDLADAMYGLGLNYLCTGDYKEAVAHLEVSLTRRQAVMQRMGAEILLDVELSRLALSRAFIGLTRLPDAMDMMRDTGKRLSKLLGNSHIYVADCLCALGELLLARARYADAARMFEKAVSIAEEWYKSSNHPEVARMQYWYAENMRLPGYFEVANEYCTKALNARMKVCGKSSIWVTQSMHQRSLLMCDIGDYESASASLIKLVKRVKKELGENMIFAMILSDAAECQRLLGKFDEARAFLSKAYSIQKAIAGHTQLDTIRTLINTVHLQMDADELPQYQRALNCMEMVIAPNLVQMLGKEHPLTMYNNANIGLCKNAITVNIMENEDVDGLIEFLGADHVLVTKFVNENQLAKNPDFLTSNDLPGQNLIDEMVSYLLNYPQLKFTADHPWLFRFMATDGEEESNASPAKWSESVENASPGAAAPIQDVESPTQRLASSARRMSRSASVPNTTGASLDVKLRKVVRMHSERLSARDADEATDAEGAVYTESGAQATAESSPGPGPGPDRGPDPGPKS